MLADKIYREHHVQSAAIVNRNNSVVKVGHTSKQVMDNKQVMRTSRTWTVIDKVDKKAVVTDVVVPKDSNIREKDE